MSRPNPTHPNPDDMLADFADRVMDGETSALASPADAELHDLEKTILRLKQTLPQAAPDERVLKHLQADFKIRAQKASPPATSVWQLLQPRQRLTLAFVGIALAVLLIAFPFLPVTTAPLRGTAGFQTQDVLLLFGIGCMVILLIWVGRRK